jgi:glutathione S-transferase
VMLWALDRRDPEGWLKMPAEGHALIDTCDGPFKQALDHAKYAVRFPDRDEAAERGKAMVFLRDLNGRLSQSPFLMGPGRTLADMAILPFVRQFANTDRAWFDRLARRVSCLRSVSGGDDKISALAKRAGSDLVPLILKDGTRTT